MNEDKVFLTKQGFEDLKKEYDLLNGAKKAEAIDRVAATRVVGELVENGDYTQAKQDLAYIEGRLQELEDVLGRATIIQDNCIDRGKVGFGCKVTVKTDHKKAVFHLVGEWEADPMRQKISHESPLGQALFGKKIGEKVEIDAPAGKLTYTILSID